MEAKGQQHFTLRHGRKEEPVCNCDRISRLFHLRVLPEFFQRKSPCALCRELRGIQTRKLPHAVSSRHIVSLVIVGRSSPEIRPRRKLNHFLSAIAIRLQSHFVQHGEQCVIIRSLYAEVKGSVNQLRGLCLLRQGSPLSGMSAPLRRVISGNRDNILSERKLIARFCPQRPLLQPEGHRHRIFTFFLRNRKRQLIRLFLQRCCRCQGLLLAEKLSFLFKRNHAGIAVRRHEQVPVHNRKPSVLKAHGNILIEEFYLLELRVFQTVRRHNSVSGEAVIRRPLHAVSAVGLVLVSIAVLFPQRLICKIPDKAALIPRLCLRKLCVLEHASVGVSHGVCILAADKGLVRMLGEELLNALHRRIHLALHIRGHIVSAIVENSLIVHQAVRIELMEAS